MIWSAPCDRDKRAQHPYAVGCGNHGDPVRDSNYLALDDVAVPLRVVGRESHVLVAPGSSLDQPANDGSSPKRSKGNLGH